MEPMKNPTNVLLLCLVTIGLAIVVLLYVSKNPFTGSSSVPFKEGDEVRVSISDEGRFVGPITEVCGSWIAIAMSERMWWVNTEATALVVVR